jgi:hypothetical protein
MTAVVALSLRSLERQRRRLPRGATVLVVSQMTHAITRITMKPIIRG